MKTNYTPGPWEINGRTIETTQKPWLCIGLLYGDSDNNGIDKTQLTGNGALISAAPELLGAVEFALKYASIPGNEFPASLSNALRNAAFKARGERII